MSRGASGASGVIMAFDYGSKRIGVAIGQGVTGTANPLVTLHSNTGKPDWEAITLLIHEWQPEALVIGIALCNDSDDNPITPATRRFIRQLAGRFRLPVYEVDERLSSVEAAHIEAARGHARAAAIDARAAQIILQTWLEQERSNTAHG